MFFTSAAEFMASLGVAAEGLFASLGVAAEGLFASAAEFMAEHKASLPLVVAALLALPVLVAYVVKLVTPRGLSSTWFTSAPYIASTSAVAGLLELCSASFPDSTCSRLLHLGAPLAYTLLSDFFLGKQQCSREVLHPFSLKAVALFHSARYLVRSPDYIAAVVAQHSGANSAKKGSKGEMIKSTMANEISACFLYHLGVLLLAIQEKAPHHLVLASTLSGRLVTLCTKLQFSLASSLESRDFYISFPDMKALQYLILHYESILPDERCFLMLLDRKLPNLPTSEDIQQAFLQDAHRRVCNLKACFASSILTAKGSICTPRLNKLVLNTTKLVTLMGISVGDEGIDYLFT